MIARLIEANRLVMHIIRYMIMLIRKMLMLDEDGIISVIHKIRAPVKKIEASN